MVIHSASTGLSYTFLITLAHHDRSNSERVIALAEKGGLSVSSARKLHCVPMPTASEWLRKYRRDGQVGRCKGTGLWRRFQSSSDAALAAEAERNPFFSTRDLKVGLHVRVESLSVAHERRSRTCNHLREPTNRDHGGLAESQLESSSCVRVN